MAALYPTLNLKLRFEWLNEIDNLIVVHIDAGKLKLEMVMTYELALGYILNLRTFSTEPRNRKLEN